PGNSATPRQTPPPSPPDSSLPAPRLAHGHTSHPDTPPPSGSTRTPLAAAPPQAALPAAPPPYPARSPAPLPAIPAPGARKPTPASDQSIPGHAPSTETHRLNRRPITSGDNWFALRQSASESPPNLASTPLIAPAYRCCAGSSTAPKTAAA